MPCRVCLILADELHVFDCLVLDPDFGDCLSYRDCFCKVTQLDVESDAGLCSDCLRELRAAFVFIEKAKQSDQIIRQNLEAENSLTTCHKIEETNTESAGLICTSLEDLDCEYETIEKYEALEEEQNSDGTEEYLSIEKLLVDDEEFITEQRTKKHRVRNTSLKAKPQTFLCHICSRTFKDASNLRRHELTHEKDRERNFTCDQCGQKFFTQGAYQSHSKTHDSNRQPLYECDECRKTFFHKSSLNLHKKYHDGKTYECKVCKKHYVRTLDLEIHMRTHSGDFPYKCDKCEKAFTQVGALNKHLLTHEGYRYKCDICEKEYVHQSTLIQHRREHTGLPLKCALCDKAFVKRSKMRRHIGGVHKIQDVEEIDSHIVMVELKKEYRGRKVAGRK